MIININELKKAYKKYKSFVYHDKNLKFNYKNLIEFELDIENRLTLLINSLKGNDRVWKNYKKELLETIEYKTFIKKVSSDNNFDENKVIINNSTDIQLFFKGGVELNIISVLWIMKIGREIDKNFSEYSYGNRLMEDDYIYGSNIPWLFKPYYEQYKNWNEDGLTEAEKIIADKNDCIILTFDIMRFYYSVDFKKTFFKEFLDYTNNQDDIYIKRINSFIYDVISNYSRKIPEEFRENRKILPIGFMPSHILSNWYLKELDKKIEEEINPVYYGRYVDDILIVDKIKKNSLSNKEEEKDEFLNKYLKGILVKNKDDRLINLASKKNLVVQKDKTNLIYIKDNINKIALEKIKINIKKNSSEFRFLPSEIEYLEDYSKIPVYLNSNNETKIRNMKNVEVNKYELTKFISKQLTLSKIIRDSKENQIYEILRTIFNDKILIENYNSWEQILSLCIINKNIDEFFNFFYLIKKAINNVVIEIKSLDGEVKDSLLEYLELVTIRALALIYGKEKKAIIEKIIKSFEYDIKFDDFKFFIDGLILVRMINKNDSIILIDFFIKEQKNRLNNLNDELIILTDLQDSFSVVGKLFEENWGLKEKINYKYFPYKITQEDIYNQYLLANIVKGEAINSNNDNIKLLSEIYFEVNFGKKYNNKSNIQILSEYNQHKDLNIIRVDNEIKNKVKIAIANVNLKETDFHQIFKNQPNRSSKRYEVVMKVINEALRENVDILVLPENFIPFEWLMYIENKCKKSQMALITGIEHVKYGKNIHNLIATILPYKNKGNKFIYKNVRNKIYYSPEEEHIITDYKCKVVEGKELNLFIWNDLWFPVYCCFEMASIDCRSRFMSISDLIIAVEWNRDTKYFRSIIESLVRDIHVYCVQVNSAKYGDSCIMRPTKFDRSVILNIKGGINNSILVGEIDIEKLRDFQIKGYYMQKKSGEFKNTPPNFDKEKVIDKINNHLFDKIKAKNENE